MSNPDNQTETPFHSSALEHAASHLRITEDGTLTDEGAPASLNVGDDSSRRRSSILVVEDGIIVGEDLRRKLQALAYDVVNLVSSGEEAIEQCAMHRPDIVLMDVRLQGAMDGIEAALQIHRRFDIPVVFVTAYSDEATLTRAKRTRPFGFVIKPAEPRELRATIELALDNHRLNQLARSNCDHYRMVFDASPDAITLISMAGRILNCNRQSAVLFGCVRPDELTARTFFDLLHPEDQKRAIDSMQQTIRTGQPRTGQYLFIRGDGTHFTGEMSIGLMGNDRQATQHFITITRDVTTREQAFEPTRKNGARRKPA